MTPEQREYFEERAAIREFDGGIPRAEAERLAMQDLAVRGQPRSPWDASKTHRIGRCEAIAGPRDRSHTGGNTNR